jgi:TolB-like protein
MGEPSFLTELKRRNVIRMAGLYLVGAWLLVQVAGTVLPMFGAPAWMPRSVVVLLALGFVPALVFSWVFELTPDGLKRDAEVRPEDSIASQTARRMEHMIVAVLLAAVVYFVFDKFVLAPKRELVAVAADRAAQAQAQPAAATKADAINPKSIAVLPFENLSEDKANGYFADGIQDQILTGLAKIGALKVISRTSTQKYASRPENLSQIARELGVAHILEGSVQRAGNQVRINVQLIEAATDSHLWAETYDRSLDDIFAVESEVAKKIAESLAATLSRGELAALDKKPTDVPQAYEAYLKARALESRTVIQSMAQAEPIFAAYREAVRLDPEFALAWAQLATITFRVTWIGLDPNGALAAEGTRALAQARALAPELPQAELARGVHLYYVERDFPAALAVMQSLRPKLPNDADLLQYIGFISRRVGGFQEAIAAFEKARELSPNDSNISYHLGTTRIATGDCAQGLRDVAVAVAQAPDNTHALGTQLQCAWISGDLAQAAAHIAAARSDSPGVEGLRGVQLLVQRDYPAAAKQLQAAIARAGDVQIDFAFSGYVPARVDWQLQLALAQQRMGEVAAAQATYQRVKAEAQAALATSPDSNYVEAAWRSALGLALAGLGEREAAIAQTRLIGQLVPEEVDRLEGPAWTYYIARIHALNGDAGRALPLLRHLLETQDRASVFGTGNMRVEPYWDGIREDPGFKSLLANPPEAAR